MPRPEKSSPAASASGTSHAPFFCIALILISGLRSLPFDPKDSVLKRRLRVCLDTLGNGVKQHEELTRKQTPITLDSIKINLANQTKYRIIFSITDTGPIFCKVLINSLVSQPLLHGGAFRISSTGRPLMARNIIVLGAGMVGVSVAW